MIEKIPTMIHTRDSLLVRIAAILQEQFDVEADSITLESRLREDLDIDSIDAVNLMIELKSITAKKITLENFHQVKTIGDLIDAILAFLNQDQAAITTGQDAS
jgi:acyl carrier protein